jgi:PAS domain S-box-containing protein
MNNDPPTPDSEQAEPRASVLLVDDSPANLLALRAVLEDLGQDLVEARSGEEALGHLLEGDFAVVLLDVQMQGLDGFETARLIRARKRSRHTPIVFVTAHSDDRLSVEQAYSLGAVDYLVKPLMPIVLRAKVAGFVELFQKTEQVRRQAERIREMQRQQFEQKLADENARFRALTEHSSDAVTLVGPDGTVLYSSPSSHRVLGYEPEEFVGRSGFEIVHPDDLERIKARLGELVGAPGAPLTAELRVRHKDGSWRWVECVGTNLLAQPAVKAVVVNYRDITDRHRATEALRDSERRLRAIIDNWPAVIFVKDAQGRYLLANRACEEYSGEPPQQMIGKTDYDYLPAEVADRFRADDRRVLQSGAVLRYEESVPLRGEVRISLTVKFPLCDSSGSPYAVCGIATDITELKRAEESLREADRRKDEFLAMLAHELRNPLGPIRNAVGVMGLLDLTDANLRRPREMIERQVQHLTRLVDDLLDVSRISRGKIKLQKGRLDLARLVRVTVEDRAPEFEKAGLSVTLQLPEVPVWVEGDPTRLAQVLDNLLQNALKFTERGGQVFVRVEADERQAAVRIRDTGAGIEPDLLARLFDTFSQADRSLDRSKGGLGLGLALVKGLVELHGGEVRAASAGKGHGAEFVFTLPRQPEPAAVTEAGDRLRTSARAGRRLRILVVEDNLDAAESLRMLLELFGHEVEVAHTGPEGVQTALQWRPDVVLCDIGLPGLDGYGVVSELRRNPATAAARVIALTGYGSDDDRRRSRQAGFDQHLTKPVDPETLKDVVALKP